MSRLPTFYRLLLILFGLVLGQRIIAEPYNPLSVKERWTTETVDLSVTDVKRKRDIPLRVYLPEQEKPAAVILFSHGLGGSCRNNAYLGNHWAGRGYMVVFIQHHGSDELVWKGKESEDIVEVLKKAASLESFLLRVGDIPVVIDTLQQWNLDETHGLYQRFNLERIGMSGHSFGAITTQAVSGQRMLGGQPMFTDSRIKAAVVMSPSSPALGSAQKAFGKVEIPWLLMTGTKDIAWIGNIDMKSRLAVYEALPTGHKYELLLYNAEHSAFHEDPLPGDTEQRNPNHHRVILALSTAFWDAYLTGDQAARTWLDGEDPLSILEDKDRWQGK